MGYYPSFDIWCRPPQRLPDVLKALAAVTDYFECDDGYDSFEGIRYHSDSWKWYDNVDDCKAASLKVPGVVIRVEGTGEEQGGPLGPLLPRREGAGALDAHVGTARRTDPLVATERSEE